MIIEPINIASESCFYSFCPECRGLGGILSPSFAVIAPSLIKREDCIINIFIYFRKSSRIHFPPDFRHGISRKRKRNRSQRP